MKEMILLAELYLAPALILVIDMSYRMWKDNILHHHLSRRVFWDAVYCFIPIMNIIAAAFVVLDALTDALEKILHRKK